MNTNSLAEDKFISEKPVQSLNRKERDRLIRRDDILRAAEYIFALKGFYEATIQDIAKEAQYATGTVYLYFKDKEALYFSLVEQKYKTLLAILIEETAKVKTPREKLEIFLAENLLFFDNNQNFFRIFISERNKSLAVKVRSLHKSSVVAQHRELADQLVRLAQEGQIIRSDFSSKQIAEILISILMSVVFNRLKEEDKNEKKLRQMSGFILDMFLNGAGKKIR